MSRSKSDRTVTARAGAFAATVGVLIIFSFVPAKWLGWAGALGDRAEMVIAPVKGPVWRLVNWLAPPEHAQPEAIRLLEEDRDRWKQAYLKAVASHEQWVRTIERQFGNGAIYSDIPTRQMVRPVIGPVLGAPGMLEIRAGEHDGVEQGAVATTEGVQLVGKVVRVGPRTSGIRLLTDTAAGTIDGLIFNPDESKGPRCQGLYPVSGGQLQTRIRVESSQKPPGVGALVRLSDDRWPRSAQMLVIGAISEPAPRQDSTGWYVVTVKPTLDLARLSEVLLRIAAPEPAERPEKPSTDGKAP